MGLRGFRASPARRGAMAQILMKTESSFFAKMAPLKVTGH
jgi:hypothetical protein